VGCEIWEDIDWHRGDIGIDIDRSIDIDRNLVFLLCLAARR